MWGEVNEKPKYANPLVGKVVRRFPSIEATGAQSVAEALIGGSWVECVSGCMSICEEEEE